MDVYSNETDNNRISISALGHDFRGAGVLMLCCRHAVTVIAVGKLAEYYVDYSLRIRYTFHHV